MSVTFSQTDLDQITAALSDAIAGGTLTTLESGINTYRVQLPGAPAPTTFTLDMEPRLVLIPFGTATVSINDDRFDGAKLHWNKSDQSLELELDVADKIDGLAAALNVAGVKGNSTYAVESARIIIEVTPRVGTGGQLDFGPVVARVEANTDDAVPAVRQTVRDTLTGLGTDIQQQAQQEFNDHRQAIVDWFDTQLAPDSRLTNIAITDTDATFQARFIEDVTGDGVVNIADLVRVARDFGRQGVLTTDLNGDGVVDIRDLVRVALRMRAGG